MTRCPWCADDPSDNVDPYTLCRSHLAEFEGLSEAELDRMEAEQAAAYADVLYA